MRKKRRWLIIAAVVLVAGLGYGAYTILGQTASGHITVSEAKSQAASLYGQKVIVAGKVVPGSVSWDYGSRVSKFSLADSNDTLDVIYRGVLPDSFRPGGDLVIEGTYNPDGDFEALSFPSRSLCSVCH